MSVDDIVIEDLSLENLHQRERIESLEADVRAYRELSQQALHALHDLTLERDRLLRQLARLHDEFRFVREHLMRESEAA